MRMKNKDNNCYEKFSVIIPTYNEEGTIVTLMELLIKLYPGITIIIADDGSSDETQKKVMSFMNQVNHVFLLDRSNEKIKGLTASVLDGIKQTKTQNFIVMDGDLQHPPESIQLIIEKLLQDFDLVIAARDNIIRTWIWKRFVGEKAAAFLGKCRLLLKGIAVQDPMSGFFGGKINHISNINPNNIQYKIQNICAGISQ